MTIAENGNRLTPLELHLKDQSLLPAAQTAIACARLAAKEGDRFLDIPILLPHGEEATAEQIIKDLHLNAFINWGGDEV